MMNDKENERERVFTVYYTLGLSSTIKCAYIHTPAKMHTSFYIYAHIYICICAASCIVVVSKIKRLVVRTRSDAREIYSNVDA